MPTSHDDDEFIWGAKAIGQEIGLDERATFRALENGYIDGAHKFGGRWRVKRSALLANPKAPKPIPPGLRELASLLSPEEVKAFFRD